MNRLFRRRTAVIVAVAALFLVPSAAVLAQSTGGAGLGGYTLDARAQAVNVTHDSPLVPSPTHPDFDGSVPAAQSTLGTGPLDHGLASIFWPGPLGGSFGSALQQIGQVCAPVLPIPGLPPVCVPVPQQLKDNAGFFNDPVKAETFYPQKPQDSAYTNIPGTTITSHVDPDGRKVTSFGQLDGFGAPGVGVTGKLTAQTIATLTDSQGTLSATSEVDNFVLADGLVTIAKVTSTAVIATDGQTATIDTKKSGTTIDGLKIAGQGATVDDQGVHIGGQTSAVHKQINQAAAQALAKAGLKFVLVPSASSTNGATGSFTAGALVLQYEDDKNTYIPGVVQNTFTIALGGATVSVDSAQGGTSNLGDTTPPAGVESSDTGSIAGPDIAPAGLGDIATPPVASAPRATTGRPAVLGTTLALSTFGLGWGLVLVAIMAAMGIAFGLRRLTDDVFTTAPAASTCPLEEGPEK